MRRGIIVYSLQLGVCELSSITSIYLLKLIIDSLADTERSVAYSSALFVMFSASRVLADMARGYYDMHVYNYFRFVTS